MTRLFNSSKIIPILITVLTVFCCQFFAGDAQAKSSDCYPATKIASYDSNDCTLCPVFRVVFNTISKIAAKSSTEFSQPVKYVVIVAFTIWLAIYLLQYLGSVETRDIKDAFQEILTKSAQVVLVVVILDTGATQFYKWLINPIYETAITGSTMAYNSGLGAATTRINLSSVPKVEEVSNGLPSSMGNKIVESMVAMENNISEIRAFGSSLICYSWERKVIIFPRLRFLLSGLFFWVMAMAVLFIVPLLLVDVVFQLGVAVALLAPSIGSYPFRPTRQYAKKVWETFLNSAFAFLFTAIIVVMISSALKTTAESLTAGTDFTWQQIMTDRSGLMDKYADQFGWFQGRMLKFVFIFVLAWSVMDMGRQFADEFAASISSTKIGGSIGTMAASTAKGMATRMSQPLLNYADSKVKQGFSHLGQWNRRRKANKAIAKADEKFTKQAQKGNVTTSADGLTASYTKKNIFGRQVTYTRDAEGNITRDVTRSKLSQGTSAAANWAMNLVRRPENRVYGASNIRTERIASGSYITIRKVKIQTMKDGSQREILVSEKIQALNKNAENLLNDKCGINTDKIAAMTAGLSGKKLEIVQQQIAQRLYAENMKDSHKGKVVNQKIISDGKGNFTIVARDTKGGFTTTQIKISAFDQKVNPNAKIYTADDLNKFMQTYDQQKNDPEKFNAAKNTMEFGKEELQAFVNGDLKLSPDALAVMPQFVEKFASGEEDENLRNQVFAKLNTLNNDRFEITSEHVSRKGRVTQSSTDGIYNRLDTFRIFDEDKTGWQRFRHNLHRAPIIIGYGARHNDRLQHQATLNSLYQDSITKAENNIKISNTDISDRETIERLEAENAALDTIEKHARRDRNGAIIHNSSWAKTGGYADLQKEEKADLDALSTVLPKGETVRKTFNWTTSSGREYGVAGTLDAEGFKNPDGSLRAKYKTDEHGHQIYMDAFGNQFAGMRDDEGVLRRINGYDDKGNPILERERRAILGIIGKKKNTQTKKIDNIREVMTMDIGNGETRDIFIKDGVISDAYGVRVYGHTERRNEYDEARFADQFRNV